MAVVSEKAEQIRKLNDDLRAGHCMNGQVLITSGIDDLGEGFKQEATKAVSEFDDFTEDNDPYAEHDFGEVEVQGQKVFFKINYYDLDLKLHSPDPADPKVTTRVLTIMLAHEY